MAVTPAMPLLKSQPDMSKLNAFAGYMVSVTKHLGPKGTPGTAVVPTQKMEKDKLLALQVHLPLQYGAGYYQFNVTDEGGTGSDEWMVKLGTEVTPTQEGLPMGMQPPFNQPPNMPGTPLDPGVTQIMPGWFYNEAANLLMAPWKKTYSWKMGDPMPDPPPTGSHLSLVPQNATPWSWPGQQQPWQSGWGGYPATETKSPELDVLKQQLAEEREARKDAERREADRQREERIREEMRRDREAADARFEKLFAALSTKPAGPSEAEQRLQREIEETRRRTEESERRASEDRKEAQRREEARIADERHREEMRLVREEIKAATTNKTDPMMTLFGTILQTQSASATETARMIRETSAAAQAASERSTTQVLELARSQRESASESSKTVLEGMKGLMEMQTGVYNQLLEVSGSSGQPWYAGVLQEGVGKIGLIGQALMERNQQPPPPQYMPPQQRIVQGRPGQPPMRVVPGQPMPQQVAAPAAPVGTGTRPPDADYDPVKEEFVFPDGWRVPQDAVQKQGWVAVLKKRPPPNVVAAPAPAVPANGVNGAAAPIATAAPPPIAPVVPDAVIPPPSAKPGKGAKKKRGAAAAPPPEPEAESGALPPPANGKGYSLEELREFDTDQILELIRPLDDTALFGAMLQYVNDLRVRAANGLPHAKAAEFILGTRQYIHSFGASPPPAFDLLASEHLEALTERLLPNAPEEYQDAVIDIMEKQIAAENPERASAAIEAQ